MRRNMVTSNPNNFTMFIGYTDFLSTGLGVQLIGFAILISMCSVVGTLGNIPVLLVYCARRDKRTANTFIKVLAVIDLVVCAVIMPYTIVYELHLVTSDIVCRLFEFLRHVAVTASNLTLVAIAVERYVAVCVIRHRLTVHNVNQGMCVVVGVSVVIATPSMAMFATVTLKEVDDVMCSFPHDFAEGFTFCHFTTGLMGPVLAFVYQAGLMIFFFFTFILIVVLYSIVYYSLWKRAQQRSRKIPASKGDVTSSLKKDSFALLRIFVQEQVEELQIADVTNDPSECFMDPEDESSIQGGSGCLELNTWDRKVVKVPVVIPPTSRMSVKKHRRTARMLFLCSVVFLVTWLPFWIDVFGYTHNLCIRYLFFIGNASNPLVYGLANPYFRQAFLKLFVNYKSLCSRF